MSVGDIEALGQLATAGLAAHAADGPDSGSHGHRHYVCRNCGMLLAGKFCAGCGQAGHVHRSIGHIGHEFLHGITHLDGKAAKTLPKLAFNPGGLTYEYVHGRRTRYIAPVALFLMCVFLMFFVFGFTGGSQVVDTGGVTKQSVADAQEAVNDAREAEHDVAGDIAEAKADSDTTPVQLSALNTAANATHLATARAEAALAAAKARGDAKPPQPLSKVDAVKRLPQLDQALADYDAKQAGKPKPSVTVGASDAGIGIVQSGPLLERVQLQRERDRVAAIASGQAPEGSISIAPGSNWADQLRDAVQHGEVTINAPTAAMRANIRHALLNPEFTLYKIQQKAYKLSFLLVPLSLPWMWLIFAWRRGHTLYDHGVFVLYSLSFMSLLLIAATLLSIAGIGNAWVFIALLVIAPLIHMFMQLKGAYKLRTFSALWRTAALSMAAFMTLGIFLTGILVLGLVE